MRDADEWTATVIILVVTMVLGFGLGLLVGIGQTTSTIRTEAAKAGVGQYIVNPQTGATSWKWTPATPGGAGSEK